MSRFTVWIVQPKTWNHARMFVDVGRALAYSLRQLGHGVAFDPGDGAEVANPKPDGRPIILAANFLPDVPLPEDAILYNFEQVPGKLGGGPGEVDALVSDAWLRGDYLKLLRRHTVWDYSATNIERLKWLGVDAIHCRVGYSPNLACIEPVAEDVDVLFYGSLQAGTRRHALYEQLCAQKVKNADGTERPIVVRFLSGVYGKERDAWIARSKIVLNVHNNNPEIAPAIFEIVRCSYLFANRKCVVSENGGQDPELEKLAISAATVQPYEKITNACRMLLENPGVARDLGNIGCERFREIDQTAEVRRALEESK